MHRDAADRDRRAAPRARPSRLRVLPEAARLRGRVGEQERRPPVAGDERRGRRSTRRRRPASAGTARSIRVADVAGSPRFTAGRADARAGREGHHRHDRRAVAAVPERAGDRGVGLIPLRGREPRTRSLNAFVAEPTDAIPTTVTISQNAATRRRWAARTGSVGPACCRSPGAWDGCPSRLVALPARLGVGRSHCESPYGRARARRNTLREDPGCPPAGGRGSSPRGTSGAPGARYAGLDVSVHEPHPLEAPGSAG